MATGLGVPPANRTADLRAYRESESEKARTADLLRLLPRGRDSVLDIGARDGHFSRLLTGHFQQVTALDLEKPSFSFPRVTTVAGDVTRLQFPDSSFDCVFCAEVLEHIPNIELACRELMRVTRYEIVVGVPFRQDTRSGRTRCRSCGKVNPPWAHVNTFDERRLQLLFPGLTVTATSFVGSTKEVTNALSSLLMDLAGNPWGTYHQDEPCIHCGATLLPPADRRSYLSRICSGVAVRLDRLQMSVTPAHANWIHVVFSKPRN
jgi:hypothetical protein